MGYFYFVSPGHSDEIILVSAKYQTVKPAASAFYFPVALNFSKNVCFVVAVLKMLKK